MSDFVVKIGTHLHASWYEIPKPAPDALVIKGASLPTIEVHVMGKVENIQQEVMTNPNKLQIFVKPDDGSETVMIRPSDILEILD